MCFKKGKVVSFVKRIGNDGHDFKDNAEMIAGLARFAVTVSLTGNQNAIRHVVIGITA